MDHEIEYGSEIAIHLDELNIKGERRKAFSPYSEGSRLFPPRDLVPIP